MRKIISVLTAVIFAVSCFSACGRNDKQNEAGEQAADNLKIVTTIFPEYDWVNEILGDNAGNADVTLLLDNSVDLHSYQPTAEDILKIADCDLFIYVGGESDEWAEDALKENTNNSRITLKLLDVLGSSAKTEEITEGMQSEETEQEDKAEYDEHVWLSLRNARVFCTAIADALVSLDAGNAKQYRSNADSYNKKLSALDRMYQSAIETAASKTLVFGDRFPFRYLTDDYGLKYYAAFAGCSAETEASFETISFLSQKVNELGLSDIMTIEGSNSKIASAIAASSKSKRIRILTLNSMQSTTAADIENGADYIQIMKSNLDVLKLALN